MKKKMSLVRCPPSVVKKEPWVGEYVRSPCPDRIRIRDLTLPCLIGVYPRERQRRQPVIINAILHGDFRRAARSGRLADAIDYAKLLRQIRAVVARSRFRLLEALAQAIAGCCLAEARVQVVEVDVEKPQAFAGGLRVAVSLQRRR